MKSEIKTSKTTYTFEFTEEEELAIQRAIDILDKIDSELDDIRYTENIEIVEKRNTYKSYFGSLLSSLLISAEDCRKTIEDCGLWVDSIMLYTD